MLRNYLITALRNLVRNRLYAAINIAGLAVGFAAALLIALYVRDEFSYDRWIPGHDRVFMLTAKLTYPGRTPDKSHRVPSELADPMKLEFPTIQAIAHLRGEDGSLRHGDIEANETYYWAEPEFFDTLPLPVVVGDPKAALSEPDGVVLTQRIAEKYFGHANPIGSTIEFDRDHVMTVRAIIQNLPSNTHLTAEIFASALASYSWLSDRKSHPHPGEWWSSTYTYLRLVPGAAPADIERQMPEFLERHMKNTMASFAKSLSLTPLTSIHLTPENGGTSMKPTSDPRTDYALAAVGGLILLVAGINFVNLMTARATRRAVEVGIRKVTGAARPDLIVQFLGESLIYAIGSAGMAMAAVWLALPSFSAFLDRAIVIDYVRDPMLLAAILGTVLVVGTLAGIYPAFVLSSFRPAVALKSVIKPGAGGDRVRRILVIVQFAILIGLAVGAGIIYRQSAFALNEGLRLDRDQVLLVGTRCQPAFVDRVRALPGVRGTACSERNGLDLSSNNNNFRRDGMEPLPLAMYGVDFGFFELYGLKPVAGRFFDRDHGSDVGEFWARDAAGKPISPNFKKTTMQGVVINETAARRFGFASPADAIGQVFSWNLTLPPGVTLPPGIKFEIIGVVSDFSLDSIHSLVSPSFYFVDPTMFNWLSVKLTGRGLPETARAIDGLWRELGEPKPITRLFMDQEVQKLYLDIQRQSALFGGFTIIALGIAALGLFGLAAFTAEQRTKEIGIRKAMGASKADILRLLLWQFTKPVLWANVIAWPAAYFIMRRWLEGFAYHIDLAPWMFFAASALALVIAIATVIGHALLVARAKPVAALRYE